MRGKRRLPHCLRGWGRFRIRTDFTLRCARAKQEQKRVAQVMDFGCVITCERVCFLSLYDDGKAAHKDQQGRSATRQIATTQNGYLESMPESASLIEDKPEGS